MIRKKRKRWPELDYRRERKCKDKDMIDDWRKMKVRLKKIEKYCSHMKYTVD